jgi:hypothetical protein
MGATIARIHKAIFTWTAWFFVTYPPICELPDISIDRFQFVIDIGCFWCLNTKNSSGMWHALDNHQRCLCFLYFLLLLVPFLLLVTAVFVITAPHGSTSVLFVSRPILALNMKLGPGQEESDRIGTSTFLLTSESS